MSILFLDFDGVLHPVSHTGLPQFVRLPMLESWLRECPAVDVVITSNWRETRTLEELRAPFSVDMRDRVVGATPVMHRVRNERWTRQTMEMDLQRHVRFLEVEMWLREQTQPDRRWAALDDVAGFYPPDCPQLVLCDGELGLSPGDLAKLDALIG